MDLKKFSEVIACILVIATANCNSSVYALNEGEGRGVVAYPLISDRVTSAFGNRIHPVKKVAAFHAGIDLSAAKNSQVFAVSRGLVVFSGYVSGLGNTVVISHGNAITTHYAHLAAIDKEAGQLVEAGHCIGRLGSTGASTGPHLHFELRKNGRAIDPTILLPGLSNKN